MASPAQILDYFAKLAPVGRGPRWDHSPAARDLVTLHWPWKVINERPGDVLVVESSAAGLTDLWRAARLHGSRGFLRLGWMFLAGECLIADRRTKVFLPIASVPVRLRRPRSGSMWHHIVADADLTVPESVFPDHVVRQRLNDELEQLAATGFPRAGPAIEWAQAQPFVDSFCDAAGLPRATRAADPAAAIGPVSGEMTFHPGLAVYTAHDRSAINLESTLREWSTERLSSTAFARLYAEAQSGAPVSQDAAVANSLPLNRRQEQAIIAARHQPVTVVSGPPGTGKTHTAVALAIDQVAHGKSVLIAAQTDDAVDAIDALLNRHASPRHIRFGSRSSRRRVANELSEGLSARTAGDTATNISQLQSMERQLASIEASVRRRLHIERDFTEALELRARHAWTLADAPGLAAILASEELSSKAVRLARRRRSEGIFAPPRRALADRGLAVLLGVGRDSLDRIAGPALELVRAERAVRAGQESAEHSIGDVFAQMETTGREVRRLFGDRLEALRSARSFSAGAARAAGLLATALRSGQAARRQALRSIDISDALHALPLWIGTIADIDDVLPVRPGMFDVVIIDEASHVNQVRAATSLARGRRSVVVGDPRQLRHVSFVSDESMKVAAAKAELPSDYPLFDVRRNSLFDVAASNTPVINLMEHYRSAPHLIDFSSREFYESRLRVMTEHPATSRQDVIEVARVPGVRDDDGVVPAEVDLIMGQIEQAARGGLSSIGVVTPFRAQADALQHEAMQRFSPQQLEQLDLRIGTVHGFQGNERDHIFISLALTPSRLRSLRFIEDPNLFNVMVTRARRHITLVTSLDADQLPPGLLLGYLRHATAGLAGPPARPRRTSGWPAAVAECLRSYGLPMWEEYPVGGYVVDIAVGDGPAAIGVECVIHPDGIEAHMERHLALRRAGWRLMSAMQSRWLSQPEGAAEAIARTVIARSGRAG